MQLTIIGTEVNIIGSNVVGFAQDNLVDSISATVDMPEWYSNFAIKTCIYNTRYEPNIRFLKMKESNHCKFAHIENGVWIIKLPSDTKGG